MNNDQFRRLVGSNTPKATAPSDGASAATPRVAALGSKQKSSIPMTPRSLGLHRPDFARQLAERNQANQPAKKFRSFDPKGSKLAQGYVDRSKERSDEDNDDRATRIKALEEALKNEEIDQATFENLRNQIAGGDLSSTYLVKGLDFKLLERVRKGEDVFREKKDDEDEPDAEDVDDALDQLEETEVEQVEREKTVKKGQLSTTSLNSSKKRSRDQILAEMKAAREAAKADGSALGTKFRKIGDKVPGMRFERDSKGREVMVIVDEDGNEKRKVRKTQAESAESEGAAIDLMLPDKDAKPLGMEVPEIYRQKEPEPEDEEVNIFDDVGDDYDPLAGLGGEESDDEEETTAEKPVNSASEAAKADRAAMPPPPPPPKSTGPPRNYFKDAKSSLVSEENLKAPSMSDPAILAAFKKAAALNPVSVSGNGDMDDEESKAKAERHRKMLQQHDRDAEDMDMGFGTSRFEDEEDFEDKKVKLSQWGRDGDDDDEKDHGGGASKRKRGPKKRKGDANSAADVMRVIEQQKAAK